MWWFAILKHFPFDTRLLPIYPLCVREHHAKAHGLKQAQLKQAPLTFGISSFFFRGERKGVD